MPVKNNEEKSTPSDRWRERWLIKYLTISAVSKQLCYMFNRPWGSELGSESDPEIRCGVEHTQADQRRIEAHW
jgi:hypothetical protein